MVISREYHLCEKPRALSWKIIRPLQEIIRISTCPMTSNHPSFGVALLSNSPSSRITLQSPRNAPRSYPRSCHITRYPRRRTSWNDPSSLRHPQDQALVETWIIITDNRMDTLIAHDTEMWRQIVLRSYRTAGFISQSLASQSSPTWRIPIGR